MRFKGGEEEAFFLSPATIQVIGNAELLGLEIGQVFLAEKSLNITSPCSASLSPWKSTLTEI